MATARATAPLRAVVHLSSAPQWLMNAGVSATWNWTRYGKNSDTVMLTAVERKSRHVFAIIMPNRKAAVVRDAPVSLLAGVRHRLHTITVDNRALFAQHRAFAHALGVKCRFAPL